MTSKSGRRLGQIQVKQKRKISARELLLDIRAGLSDQELIEKYHLTHEGLQYLIRRLVEAGMLTQMELYARSCLSESDVTRAFGQEPDPVLKCPQCGAALPAGTASCPNCTTMRVAYGETLVMDTAPSTSSEREVDEAARDLSETNVGGMRDNSSEISTTLVRELVQWGSEIDAGETRKKVTLKDALLKAASKGYLDYVEKLLDKDVDVNCRSKYGNTPLIRSAFKGHARVGEVLLDQGADIDAANNDGNTALILACNEGREEMAEMLLERGADPQVENLDGNTALIAASVDDRTALVKLILDYGARVDHRNKDLDTALTRACDHPRRAVAEVLIDGGADVNMRNKYGNTPLLKAVLTGDAMLVRLLLQSGADVNVKNNYGNTPLMKACHKGHVKIAQLLLEAGADVWAEDVDGNTAMSRASASGRPELLELLGCHSDDRLGRPGDTASESEDD